MSLEYSFYFVGSTGRIPFLRPAIVSLGSPRFYSIISDHCELNLIYHFTHKHTCKLFTTILSKDFFLSNFWISGTVLGTGLSFWLMQGCDNIPLLVLFESWMYSSQESILRL